ncbi:MAG: PQQ-dependent sugar dehydrogenase [Chitinophagales bacterium]
MRRLKILFLFFLFGFSIWAINYVLNRIDLNPLKNEYRYHQSLKKTKTTYTRYCQRCHGKQEACKFNFRFGTSLNEIKKNITHGISSVGMPSFADSLSSDKIKELAKFIYNYREYTFDELHQYKLKNTTIYTANEQQIYLDTFFYHSEILIPWSIEFIDTQTILISDRNNGLYYFNKTKNIFRKIKHVPNAASGTFGGYLDIALHPNFSNNNLVYFAYTKKYGAKLSLTVMRAILNLETFTLTATKDIFKALPESFFDGEFGSRLLFGKDTCLYITVGHCGSKEPSILKLDNHLGKVIRIRDDGTIPKDNPYIDTKNALPEIYAIGLRNSQGLAIDTNGNIWSNEHGPKGGDELNIIEKGANYGWPIVSYGINYDGSLLTKYTKKDGIKNPIHYWTPSIAPCGMDFLNNDKYGKSWRGNLFIASLKFDYLLRVVLKNNSFEKEETLFKGVGRVRDVKIGKDGYIYFTTEGLKDYVIRKGKPGIIFRLIPIAK